MGIAYLYLSPVGRARPHDNDNKNRNSGGCTGSGVGSVGRSSCGHSNGAGAPVVRSDQSADAMRLARQCRFLPIVAAAMLRPTSSAAHDGNHCVRYAHVERYHGPDRWLASPLLRDA
jgi:hypothetical protein